MAPRNINGARRCRRTQINELKQYQQPEKLPFFKIVYMGIAEGYGELLFSKTPSS